MKKVPYTNRGTQRTTIAGVAVRPGETIYIDPRDHPDYKPPPKQAGREPKQHSDPVLKILDRKIADIVPELPLLTAEHFDKIQQAERDGNKTRVTLKRAFDEEHLRRASVEQATGAGYDEFLAQLNSDTAAVQALLDAEQSGDNRQAIVEALEAELARRKAAGDDGQGE